MYLGHFIFYLNSRLNCRSKEKGSELPPTTVWQQFPALLFTPAVEPRVLSRNTAKYVEIPNKTFILNSHRPFISSVYFHLNCVEDRKDDSSSEAQKPLDVLILTLKNYPFLSFTVKMLNLFFSLYMRTGNMTELTWNKSLIEQVSKQFSYFRKKYMFRISNVQYTSFKLYCFL